MACHQVVASNGAEGSSGSRNRSSWGPLLSAALASQEARMREVMDEESKQVLCKNDPYSGVDWRYEFSAPKFYDFTYEESEEDVAAAESWFDNAIPYENSPHVAKTKSISELWSAAMSSKKGAKREAMQILAHVSPKPDGRLALDDGDYCTEDCPENLPDETRDAEDGISLPHREFLPPGNGCPEQEPYTPEGRVITGVSESDHNRTPPSALAALVISPGSLPAKRLYSDAWNEAPLAEQEAESLSKSRLSFSGRGHWDTLTKKENLTIAGATCGTQAQKKQKLEDGRLQKLLYMKDRLPRPKDPPTLTIPHEFSFQTNHRARLHQGDTKDTTTKTSPFVSMAERIRRFHLKTPERYHIQSANSSGQAEVYQPEKPKLKLTVAKTPEFETSQRCRAPKVKSAAEIEEEMLAKIPKFKARPLPKKILEAPALPTFTKSAPQVIEFKEFHLHTSERAQHHANSSASSSTESLPTSAKTHPQKPSGVLTHPQPPQLETANRARPTTVKSREELEEEEIAKMPKFKARPLNKMIFQSKGELGVPRNQKRDVTLPQEFHFKTQERAQARGPPSLADQLLKLTLNKPTKVDAALRRTKLEPFHLATDDRGLAREMWEIHERIQKDHAEAEARIPKAKPLPYTTDYPEVPSKPLPKECTKPDPFHLESLIRHELNQERLAEERAQAEQQEAALKAFRAQPNMSNVSIPVPEKQRKPLTEIQEFNFLADQRAVERAEFEKKVAEKQYQYKRYRKEYDAARKAEEDRFIKAMRREMVPTARPMPLYPKPSEPKRSTKGPTKAMSPLLHKRVSRRERQRSLTTKGTRIQLR